ncbi:phospholipid/cholesterol/gamma-HCH transport system ATP-binding protein [Rhodopseudomonas julia]|uniref:Phospholipid/cholesterol/gamma-HCH transport system ATP-binding protein n=1 Tax=Rhodopseudomonas julia TaxID=200617 RepID=A0ABU0C8G0_9BRAD|nr:ATP-binding cassette domain-containing protein [Rhodopseudomonas julia]MDQ0326785.1 phospholipid/cholesterol/gamma-HCH transport system ATP-binding protein [Rhodopseudomonas julia]
MEQTSNKSGKRPDGHGGGKAKQPIISVRGLTVGFGDKPILQNLDLDIYRGEVLAVVGASGAGKSVLTRAILGLLPRREGQIVAFGHDLTEGGNPELERRWGVLFQQGALFSGLTVADNIMVPMREYLDLPEPLMEILATMKVELVGLRAADGIKYPSELSGGMIKRAALARALALDPEIVFLDEPTSGLDPISAAAFDRLIADLRETLGLTVVMVTHDLDTLHAIVDRIAVVGEKRILVEGDIAAMERFDHPWVRDYFSGERARAAGLSEVSR